MSMVQTSNRNIVHKSGCQTRLDIKCYTIQANKTSVQDGNDLIMIARIFRGVSIFCGMPPRFETEWLNSIDLRECGTSSMTPKTT
jgi:hypothetical protein